MVGFNPWSEFFKKIKGLTRLSPHLRSIQKCNITTHKIDSFGQGWIFIPKKRFWKGLIKLGTRLSRIPGKSSGSN
jgi:hypothetical protein